MRAVSAHESWEECREDPDYAPAAAWELLAAWGALNRFFEQPPVEVASIVRAAERDATTLLAALRQAAEPAEWLDRARDVDRAWDFAVREEPLRELEVLAIDLFDLVDRHGVALCMARRLNSGSEAETLSRRAEQLAHAELFFAQHIDAFMPAAPLASRVIAALRADLEQADPELWRTTQIHRLLAEAWKQAEGGGSPPCFTDRDKQAILAKVAQAKLLLSPANSPSAKYSPVFRSLVAEHVAREHQSAMAAATPEQALTPARSALARQAFPIEGDEAVQVKLDLRPAAAPASLEIWVRLGAPLDKVGQYVQCEVKVPDLPAPLIGKLDRPGGMVSLTEAQFHALRKGEGNIALTLVTADGTRRAALLG